MQNKKIKQKKIKLKTWKEIKLLYKISLLKVENKI